MGEKESVEDFAENITEYVSQFDSLGSPMEDHELVKKLLDSIPDHFIAIVATIEQWADLNTMVFEDCIARLKAFQKRIKGKEAMAEMGKLLYAKNDNQGKKDTDHDWKNYARGRGSSSYDQQGHGRGSSRGRGRFNQNYDNRRDGNQPNTNNQGRDDNQGNNQNNQNQGRDKSGVRCYNCNVLGHFAWECPRPPTQGPNLNQAEAKPPTLMMASIEVDKEQVMLNEEKVHPIRYADDSVSDSIWYLDNGASNHMTGCEAHFAQIDYRMSGLVKFGDGSKVNIKGRGSIIFDCKNGEQRVMNDVYYIPDLCSNILSISQLAEEGCKVWIANNHLWLYEEGDRLLMRVPRSPHRLYKIELRIETPVCVLASIKDQGWLWHARLGHVNFETLTNMKSKNMVHGDIQTLHESQKFDWSRHTDSFQVGTRPEWVEFTIDPVQEEVQKEIPVENEDPTDLNGPEFEDQPEENPEPELRRTGRQSVPSKRFEDYVMWCEGECLLLVEEPATFEEAKNSKNWREAMRSALVSIEQNNTWDLCGSITKYKARLVAKGYAQEHEVDFDEVFARVARMETVRLILAIAANYGWFIYHLDVKSAFLNGELKEEVYVKQPHGFEVLRKHGMVYKLRKALYGLRQAPRAWNEKFNKTLKGLDFIRCPRELAVYKRNTRTDILIVGVYVDDLIVPGSSQSEIEKFKSQMKNEFEMQDLGKLSYYLGIEVTQKKHEIKLKKEAYANKILMGVGLSECNPTRFPVEHRLQVTKDEEGEPIDATEYRRIIGSLRYLTHTRPDLSYSVGVASRFMQEPKQSHMQILKYILRYVQGTSGYGLTYGCGSRELVGFLTVVTV
ncbi:uncharacterized protein LOC143538844 [Bidens hawaiensis]|uniref:uncharacterized protein LOC143538844 n=1 Tax=Bidens hawaiensis TaxID=980011 RepID=UPI004048FE29